MQEGLSLSLSSLMPWGYKFNVLTHPHAVHLTNQQCEGDDNTCQMVQRRKKIHLHGQLHHHANDPLSTGSEMKAFKLTDPAHIQKDFGQIHLKSKQVLLCSQQKHPSTIFGK